VASFSYFIFKGNGDIFESNMLVDFDEIAESENVAPVHEAAKMPQYHVKMQDQKSIKLTI
jgi:hypothetical protein